MHRGIKRCRGANRYLFFEFCQTSVKVCRIYRIIRDDGGDDDRCARVGLGDQLAALYIVAVKSAVKSCEYKLLTLNNGGGALKSPCA